MKKDLIPNKVTKYFSTILTESQWCVPFYKNFSKTFNCSETRKAVSKTISLTVFLEEQNLQKIKDKNFNTEDVIEKAFKKSKDKDFQLDFSPVFWRDYNSFCRNFMVFNPFDISAFMIYLYFVTDPKNKIGGGRHTRTGWISPEIKDLSTLEVENENKRLSKTEPDNKYNMELVGRKMFVTLLGMIFYESQKCYQKITVDYQGRTHTTSLFGINNRFCRAFGTLGSFKKENIYDFPPDVHLKFFIEKDLTQENSDLLERRLKNVILERPGDDGFSFLKSLSPLLARSVHGEPPENVHRLKGLTRCDIFDAEDFADTLNSQWDIKGSFFIFTAILFKEHETLQKLSKGDVYLDCDVGKEVTRNTIKLAINAVFNGMGPSSLKREHGIDTKQRKMIKNYLGTLLPKLYSFLDSRASNKKSGKPLPLTYKTKYLKATVNIPAYKEPAFLACHTETLVMREVIDFLLRKKVPFKYIHDSLILPGDFDPTQLFIDAMEKAWNTEIQTIVPDQAWYPETKIVESGIDWKNFITKN